MPWSRGVQEGSWLVLYRVVFGVVFDRAQDPFRVASVLEYVADSHAIGATRGLHDELLAEHE